MLTITHTHESGTLIDGTSKGDGTNTILKQNGWRWSRNLGSWYVPQSRDKNAKTWVINATVTALQDAGHQVETDIDNTPRATADVMEDKAERANDRAEALAAKADRKTAEADAAWDKHKQDVARLPEGGEPVKVDHHSGARHQNAINKAHRSMGRYSEAATTAEETADRAATAASTASHQGVNENPVTTANRIERLKAEHRKLGRQITADRYHPEHGFIPPTPEQIEATQERLDPRLNQLHDQITYWEEIRAKQIATGKATNFSKDTVKKGDLVKIRGYWHKVARANAKTVAVETEYSWTDKTPWHEVQAHQPAATQEA